MQFQQPGTVVRQLQFFGRAQHALAFHATQLTQFDEKRFTILAGWQCSAHQGARHLDAHPCIRGTTHNLKRLRSTNIHLAHSQAIGIGMLLGRLDFTHHHLAERRCNRVHLFHLQTRHGQGVSELLGVDGWVAKFAQPGFRKLHEEALRTSLKLA